MMSFSSNYNNKTTDQNHPNPLLINLSLAGQSTSSLLLALCDPLLEFSSSPQFEDKNNNNKNNNDVTTNSSSLEDNLHQHQQNDQHADNNDIAKIHPRLVPAVGKGIASRTFPDASASHYAWNLVLKYSTLIGDRSVSRKTNLVNNGGESLFDQLNSFLLTDGMNKNKNNSTNNKSSSASSSSNYQDEDFDVYELFGFTRVGPTEKECFFKPRATLINEKESGQRRDRAANDEDERNNNNNTNDRKNNDGAEKAPSPSSPSTNTKQNKKEQKDREREEFDQQQAELKSSLPPLTKNQRRFALVIQQIALCTACIVVAYKSRGTLQHVYPVARALFPRAWKILISLFGPKKQNSDAGEVNNIKINKDLFLQKDTTTTGDDENNNTSFTLPHQFAVAEYMDRCIIVYEIILTQLLSSQSCQATPFPLALLRTSLLELVVGFNRLSTYPPTMIHVALAKQFGLVSYDYTRLDALNAAMVNYVDPKIPIEDDTNNENNNTNNKDGKDESQRDRNNNNQSNGDDLLAGLPDLTSGKPNNNNTSNASGFRALTSLATPAPTPASSQQHQHHHQTLPHQIASSQQQQQVVIDDEDDWFGDADDDHGNNMNNNNNKNGVSKANGDDDDDDDDNVFEHVPGGTHANPNIVTYQLPKIDYNEQNQTVSITRQPTADRRPPTINSNINNNNNSSSSFFFTADHSQEEAVKLMFKTDAEKEQESLRFREEKRRHDVCGSRKVEHMLKIMRSLYFEEEFEKPKIGNKSDNIITSSLPTLDHLPSLFGGDSSNTNNNGHDGHHSATNNNNNQQQDENDNDDDQMAIIPQELEEADETIQRWTKNAMRLLSPWGDLVRRSNLQQVWQFYNDTHKETLQRKEKILKREAASNNNNNNNLHQDQQSNNGIAPALVHFQQFHPYFGGKSSGTFDTISFLNLAALNARTWMNRWNNLPVFGNNNNINSSSSHHHRNHIIHQPLSSSAFFSISFSSVLTRLSLLAAIVADFLGNENKCDVLPELLDESSSEHKEECTNNNTKNDEDDADANNNHSDDNNYKKSHLDQITDSMPNYQVVFEALTFFSFSSPTSFNNNLSSQQDNNNSSTTAQVNNNNNGFVNQQQQQRERRIKQQHFILKHHFGIETSSQLRRAIYKLAKELVAAQKEESAIEAEKISKLKATHAAFDNFSFFAASSSGSEYDQHHQGFYEQQQQSSNNDHHHHAVYSSLLTTTENNNDDGRSNNSNADAAGAAARSEYDDIFYGNGNNNNGEEKSDKHTNVNNNNSDNVDKEGQAGANPQSVYDELFYVGSI